MSTFDPSNQRLDPPESDPHQTQAQSSRFQSHLQPPSEDHHHRQMQQENQHQDHTHQDVEKNQDRFSIAHTRGAPKGVEQTQKKPGLMGLGHGFPGASGRNTPSLSQGQRTPNGQSFDEASIRRIVQEEFKKKEYHHDSDQKDQHQKSGLSKGSKFDENETFDQIGIDIKQSGEKKQQSSDSNVKEKGEKAFDLDDSRGSKPHKGGTKFYEEGHDGLDRKNVFSRSFADENEQVAIGDGDGNSIRILDEGTLFPNPWTRLRYVLREGLAEMIGTFILVLFGNGVNAQVTVSSLYDAAQPKGQFLSIAFGWELESVSEFGLVVESVEV